MARDESLADIYGGTFPREPVARVPLAALLVVIALGVLAIGMLMVLVVVNNDKEGKALYEADSPSVICQDLYNEIPLEATEFDPDLNAEYRSCVRKESLKRYASVGLPFLLPALALVGTAVWISVRRRLPLTET